jgi:hypothetical protein
MAMDWKTRMKTDEAELRALVDRLGALQDGGTSVSAEREYTMRTLARKLAEMRRFVDDCLCGRNTYEQQLLSYRMRLEYPLYCHLDSLSGISREYVDWSCA